MKDLVGYCAKCKIAVYCLDGFINGVAGEKNCTLLCFDCYEKLEASHLQED